MSTLKEDVKIVMKLYDVNFNRIVQYRKEEKIIRLKTAREIEKHLNKAVTYYRQLCILDEK